MLINNFFQDREFVIDKLKFSYLGGQYTGKGFLTWSVEKGFHLDAFLEREGPTLRGRSYGAPKYIKKKDRINIRLILKESYNWGIIKNVYLGGHLEVEFEDRLSLDFSSLILSIAKNDMKNFKDKYYGSSLYFGIHKNHIFPDSLCKTLYLNDRKIQKEISHKGLIYDEPSSMQFKGFLKDNKYFELYWSLNKKNWTRSESWNWPDSFVDAFLFLSGKSIQIVYKMLQRGNQTYFQVSKPKKNIDSLDSFTLLQSPEVINKKRLIRFIEFFSRNSKEATTSQKILSQMTEAVNQKSWQGLEFMLSTVLEAALRTILNKPFVYNRKPRLNIQDDLQKFRKNYLTKEWKSICCEVSDVWKRLRDRSAHPDWLFDENDILSDQRKKESLNDMMFLKTFYGYMILAMSGEKNIEPNFKNCRKF